MEDVHFPNMLLVILHTFFAFMLTASKYEYTYILSKAIEVHTLHYIRWSYLSLNIYLWNNLATALGKIMNLQALATRCTSSACLATIGLPSYLQEFLETFAFLCDERFEWL
jgi:hypothetical protein